MLHSKLIELMTSKERVRICLLGLPASGKSHLAREIRDFLTSRGYSATIVAMVDVIINNRENQDRILDFYQFVCANNFVAIIFDGWAYEAPPESAVNLCDQVWLICPPPWLLLARRRSRGFDVPPDTNEFWTFYREEVPEYLEMYKDSEKFLLVEWKDGIYQPIENYSQWLELAADPTEEDEKALLKETRPVEYQSFNLPFGGKINAADATEKVVRTALKYLPNPAFIKRAVDVGCEFGKACFMLARWGVREVQGIDHDPRVIQIAKRLQKLFYSHANFELVRGELYDFNNVDLALCLSVSHHLPSPELLYSKLMRAKYIVIELPYHLFSIFEEASHKLNRHCMAAWPSPKRDREVRIYCAPELVPGYLPAPEKILDKQTYFNSGVSKKINRESSFWDFLPDSQIEGNQAGVNANFIIHENFAHLQYIPPEGTDTIECEIDYTTERDVPVWLQYDWTEKSGTTKMKGEGYLFSGNNLLKITKSRPWESFGEPLSHVCINIRPDPGKDNWIRINSVTIIARS